MPVSPRSWSGTLCGSVVVSGLRRSARSVSWNVPAPVPPAGCRVNACHSSVHQRQRLLELRLGRAARLRVDLARDGVRERVPDAPRVRAGHGEPGEHGDERGEGGDSLHPPPHARAERAPALETRERERRGGDGRSGSEHAEREDPAVVRAHRAGLAVLRDPGQGEREAEDGCCGAAAEHGDDEALDAVPVEHEPAGRRDDGERDAEARVREERREHRGEEQDRAPGPDARAARPRRGEPERERHGDVSEQRELVPVADRRAEAGEAERRGETRLAAVRGIERGNALREQRPAEDEREQQRPPHGRAGPPSRRGARRRARRRPRTRRRRACGSSSTRTGRARSTRGSRRRSRRRGRAGSRGRPPPAGRGAAAAARPRRPPPRGRPPAGARARRSRRAGPRRRRR